MANRSYLFSTDRAPAKLLDRGTFYAGVGEWSYHVPALALLPVSNRCEIGVSVLDSHAARDGSGAPANMPSLYGTGLARTFKLLRIIEHIAQDRDDDILMAEVEAALTCLRGARGTVSVLEVGELLRMSADDPQAWHREAGSLRNLARDLGQAVDALPDAIPTAARELEATLAEGGLGPLSALTLGLARNDSARDTGALGLDGFTQTLSCDPQPRTGFLADVSDRLRENIIAPRITALFPAPVPDWALVVERTQVTELDDGTLDRRYAFVLVSREPRLLGLRKRYAVSPDPDIGDAHLTAARLLEWRAEADRDLSCIAIRADRVVPLGGSGQSEALFGGQPGKPLLAEIFAPVNAV